MVILAQFLGTLFAHLTDPFMWVVIIFAAGLGWGMAAWYWLIVVAALSAGFNLLNVYVFWTRLFRPDEIVTRGLRLVLIHLIIVFAAYGFSYGVAYWRSAKRDPEAQREAKDAENSVPTREAPALTALLDDLSKMPAAQARENFRLGVQGAAADAAVKAVMTVERIAAEAPQQTPQSQNTTTHIREQPAERNKRDTAKSPAFENQEVLAARMNAQAVSCIKDLEGKWSLMSDQLKFMEGVSLDEQMFMFSIPIFEFVQEKYPLLLAHPDASGSLQVMLIGNAVINSGSHPAHEVSAALPLLNDRLLRYFES